MDPGRGWSYVHSQLLHLVAGLLYQILVMMLAGCRFTGRWGNRVGGYDCGCTGTAGGCAASSSQPTDKTIVLDVVQALLEVLVVHLEEDLACEQAVRTRLVLSANTLDSQLISNFLQASI